MNLPFIGIMSLLVFGSIAQLATLTCLFFGHGPNPPFGIFGYWMFLGHLAGLPFRVTDQFSKVKKTFAVYSLAGFIAAAIFLPPWNYFKTGSDVDNLRPPKVADMVSTLTASPLTKTTPACCLGQPILRAVPLWKLKK
jgi:hypothetical protein